MINAVKQLNAKQLKVANAVVEFGSTSLVCKNANISRSTLWEYNKLPEFQREVRRLRSAASRETNAVLQRFTTKAVLTLVEIMSNVETQDSVRLSAARTILELSHRGQELTDVKDELDELKELLSKRENSDKGLRLIK